MRCAFVLLLAVCSPSLVLADDGVLVRGRVLDADGKAVPGVKVGRTFLANGGKMIPVAPTRTNSEGRYQLELHFDEGGPPGLVAIGREGLTGGIAAITSASDLRNVDLRLTPLTDVRGTLLCADLGGPRSPRLVVYAEPSGAPVVMTPGGMGRFTLRLPQGRYKLVAAATVDHTRHQQALVVGEEEMLLGDIVVEGAPHTKHLGARPPAWTVGAARGLELPVKEEDFDGRWLVVGFVDVRTAEGRATAEVLARVWKQGEPHADRLAVVAFHAPWAKTHAEVDAKLGKLKLPFPDLLDPSGKTHAAWEVGKEPRILLLDPEGRLQRWEPARLFERLRR